MEKEKETEKKKKKQGEKEVLQFYIYKLPIDRPAAVTGNNIIRDGGVKPAMVKMDKKTRKSKKNGA